MVFLQLWSLSRGGGFKLRPVKLASLLSIKHLIKLDVSKLKTRPMKLTSTASAARVLKVYIIGHNLNKLVSN
jgi:hypothetical protein